MTTLTKQEIIDAVRARKTVSYGNEFGCDRDYIVLSLQGTLVWRHKRAILTCLEYPGLVIE